MSLSRAVSSSLGCTACKSAIARSSRAHLPSNGFKPHASWKSPITPSSRPFQRSFTSNATFRADKDDPATEDPQFAFLDPEPAASEPTPTPTPASESASAPEPAPAAASIPWYLQNRPTPTPHQAALIPDLPPNPPPLLATLLDYLANTAGLDDITLLDLRHLDPPPALGPKLIMVICSARSEKHLHVSADRFSRHLRREYRLKPNPAGLLGRNELKIKLRRKAKRMKMLANVGGAEQPEGNIDDGIRTGWICCTVGKIEAHEADTHMPGDDVEEFVGFRDMKPGVNVVVQMFTEEKRAEVDLETLWSGVLKTHERKDRTAEEALKALEEVEEEVENRATEPVKKPVAEPTSEVPPVLQFKKTRPTAGDVFPPASNPEAATHMRRLHTVGLRV
ncbi:hypothetical protein BS50DRAFT_680250 [Corynespora cassiicola Philippines]|uniref:ATPase synthesis protein 25 n=1 Tax=Corynespora cassiicola Philippines TaxID=1448308 RepID=A0A2T2N927_CORCC|nr:hypothetical protein BS50DRAFT_680250 [Corynespora cassiicola Philippines]